MWCTQKLVDDAIAATESNTEPTRSLSYKEILSAPPRPLSAPPPLDLTTLTLLDLEDVIWGYDQITFDEFCTIFHGTTSADRNQTVRKWNWFTENPMLYCTNTIRKSNQAERLTQLALSKAQARRVVR